MTGNSAPFLGDFLNILKDESTQIIFIFFSYIYLAMQKHGDELNLFVVLTFYIVNSNLSFKKKKAWGPSGLGVKAATMNCNVSGLHLARDPCTRKKCILSK